MKRPFIPKTCEPYVQELERQLQELEHRLQERECQLQEQDRALTEITALTYDRPWFVQIREIADGVRFADHD